MNLPGLAELDHLYTRIEVLALLGWSDDKLRIRLKSFPKFDPQHFTGRQVWRLARSNLPRGSLPPMPRREPARRHGTIYVIQALPGTPVKIGFTTSDTEARNRAMELQTGNPHPLRVIATVAGSFDDEQAVHRALSQERLTGEWFDLSGRTLAFIERLRSHGLADAIAAVLDLPPPDVPLGWDRLFIAEASISATFGLSRTNLVQQARRAGNGPPFSLIERSRGQMARYYRLDYLKRWLDEHNHLFRLDRNLWAHHIISVEGHTAGTPNGDQNLRRSVTP